MKFIFCAMLALSLMSLMSCDESNESTKEKCTDRIITSGACLHEDHELKVEVAGVKRMGDAVIISNIIICRCKK